MPGYLAFPPTVPPFASKDTGRFSIEDEQKLPDENIAIDDAEKQTQALEDAWQERQRRDAETRQRRLDQAQTAALQGEIDWVRSGGILRDSQGQRDYVRTEHIRKELRLQAEEMILVEQWETYERKWRSLLSSTSPVTFPDIPWPMQKTPLTVEELNSHAITNFLLNPLRVRTNTTTERERIRASLLRWHPDKMASIMSRVVEADEPAVRDGVNAVFLCLKQLQDASAGKGS